MQCGPDQEYLARLIENVDKDYLRFHHTVSYAAVLAILRRRLPCDDGYENGNSGKEMITMLQKALRLAFALLVFSGLGASSLEAQHYHRRSIHHHHHDAAGHRIDDAGHHIDRYGNHTGAVGVFDNGAVQYPATIANGYRINGSAYYPAQAQSPMYLPPQQVATSRPPQNVLPGTFAPQSNGTITILNPADSGGEVAYNLNDATYSIKPGYSQTIVVDRTWVISFGSGGPRGDIRYTLSAGTFKFKPTPIGWELVRAVDQPAALEIAPTPSPDQP